MDKSEKTKKRLLYSEENMKNAVTAVKTGKLTIYKAHKEFGVPRTTLIDKVKGRVPLERKIGIETVLTKEEEDLLVKWIFHVAECGFPITKIQLIDSVQILVKNLKRPNTFKDGRPGRKWYDGFISRHPEVSRRVSQNLTNARANVSENKIRKWFSEITEYLKNNNYYEITEDPTRVFNCDETAFFLSPKNEKVLVKKGEKAVYTFINNDEKECLTTLLTCSASGRVLPPMIVYSYKRIPKHIAEKVPDDWGIGRSDSGWMTGETFFEYLANVFNPWLINNNISKPVILFMDGHTSHLTMASSDFASQNGIILISLFPNSTHILQPLDVAVFRPLKSEWKTVVCNWRITNNGNRLGRDIFAQLLRTTLDNMKNVSSIIKNGFKACGLFPLNPDNVNYKKYFKEISPLQTDIRSNIQPVTSKEDLKKFLDFFEKLNLDKIDQFKLAGETWDGPLEDLNLFKFWRSLKVLENTTNILTHVTADQPYEEEYPDYDVTDSQNENQSEQQLFDEEIQTENQDITDLIDISNIDFDKGPLILTVDPASENTSEEAPFHVVTSAPQINCDIENEKPNEQDLTSDLTLNHAVDDTFSTNCDISAVDTETILENICDTTAKENEIRDSVFDDVEQIDLKRCDKQCSDISSDNNLNINEIPKSINKNENENRKVPEEREEHNNSTSENNNYSLESCKEQSFHPEMRADVENKIENETINKISETQEKESFEDMNLKKKTILKEDLSILNNERVDSREENKDEHLGDLIGEDGTNNNCINTENEETTGLENHPKETQNETPVKTSKIDVNVPSPFKKALFWPESGTNTKKRKTREKIPSVATSQEWKLYYQKKEEKKNNEVLKKQRLMEERKRKLEQKEKQKNEKMAKKKKEENPNIPGPSRKDDTENVTASLELENRNFNVDDFVIVNFNENLLPGQIINIRIQKNETKYEVNHMEAKGLSWIWPQRKDIFSYNEDEIVMKIKEPVLKNKRGLYSVDEISEYE